MLSRIRDGFESDDDFVAELEPIRRKVNRSRPADGAKEAAAAAASLSFENLIGILFILVCVVYGSCKLVTLC